jgi:hypothetical protein
LEVAAIVFLALRPAGPQREAQRSFVAVNAERFDRFVKIVVYVLEHLNAAFGMACHPKKLNFTAPE